MFGLGFGEVILILLAILLFVKPEDLPKFVRRVGQFYGNIQETYQMFVSQLRNAEYKIKDAIEDLEEKVDKGLNTEDRASKTAKRSKKTGRHQGTSLRLSRTAFKAKKGLDRKKTLKQKPPKIAKTSRKPSR